MSRSRAQRARLALFALAALAGCKDEKPVADAGPRSLADLLEVRGGVQLTRASAAEAASPGPLYTGDVLDTADDGHAVVALPGGRRVEVSGGSSFSVGEGDEGALRFKVDKGLVLTRMPAGEASGGLSFALLTPYGITRVPAGASDVEVKVTGEEATLTVRLGSVVFVGKDGKENVAMAGEVLKVRLGQVTVTRPDASLPREPLDLSLSPMRGAVKLREPSAKRFRAAGKREVLSAGSRFQFPRGALAHLTAGGLSLAVEGESAGTAGEAFREAGEERVDLRLDSGPTIVTTPAKAARRRLKLDGPLPVTVALAGEANLKLRPGARVLRLEAVAGEAELTFGRETQKISAGLVAEVTRAGGIRVSPLPRAAVALSPGRKVRVIADGLKEVAVTWPQDGTTWRRVEVARDAAFKAVILAGPVLRGFLNVPAPPSGELAWRVFEPGGDKPVARGAASFEADRGRSSLLADNPKNDVVDSGLKTTVFFQGALPALTFVYAADPKASRYRLRVYRASDLATPLVDRTVTDVRAPLEAGALPEGEYRWYASPLDASGAEVTGGRMNKLDVTYDNSLPSLLIGQPRPGERVKGRDVEAAGVAPLGARVFVNGTPAATDEKGRFRVRTGVGAGGAVVFKLLDAAGDERLWVRFVKVGGVNP